MFSCLTCYCLNYIERFVYYEGYDMCFIVGVVVNCFGALTFFVLLIVYFVFELWLYWLIVLVASFLWF